MAINPVSSGGNPVSDYGSFQADEGNVSVTPPYAVTPPGDGGGAPPPDDYGTIRPEYAIGFYDEGNGGEAQPIYSVGLPGDSGV